MGNIIIDIVVGLREIISQLMIQLVATTIILGLLFVILMVLFTPVAGVLLFPLFAWVLVTVYSVVVLIGQWVYESYKRISDPFEPYKPATVIFQEFIVVKIFRVLGLVKKIPAFNEMKDLHI